MSQAEMKQWYEGTMQSVKTKSEEMERDYLQPVMKHSKAYAERRPVFSLFATIFAVLSIAPVGIFLFLSMCVLGITLFIAAGFIMLACFVFLCLAGPIFIFVMISTVVLSLYFCSLAVSGYLLRNLYRSYRSSADWRSGLNSWSSESQQLLFGRPIIIQPLDLKQEEPGTMLPPTEKGEIKGEVSQHSETSQG